MLLTIQRLCLAISFSLLLLPAISQPAGTVTPDPSSKPYKVLTSGKQVTIKSTQNISRIMLWTSGGNRVVEQKELNTTSVTFTVPVNQKAYFLMVTLDNGKVYTERIGVR